MIERIPEEVALLRLHYEAVEYEEASGQHWFHVSGFRTPKDWSPDVIAVAFSVTPGYPGAQPYGFYVPEGLRYRGQTPAAHRAPHPPPFPGQWIFLSWQPVGWRPAADVRTGSNLWAWVRSFQGRLQEGV